jgi:hypothetical protein
MIQKEKGDTIFLLFWYSNELENQELNSDFSIWPALEVMERVANWKLSLGLFAGVTALIILGWLTGPTNDTEDKMEQEESTERSNQV